MNKMLAVVALIAGFSTSAYAESYSFACISNTNVANCASGSAYLRVAVLAVANANQALFQFYNDALDNSSIADVYFDDGTLLDISQINNSTGVSFTRLATPAELPAATNATPAFMTTAGFSADSDSPVSKNGVNPGETLGILFDLQPGKTYSSVINALSLGGADGGLRIGLHVQSFGNGGSESFINAVTPVPEASQWLMMLVGIGYILVRTLDRHV